MKDGFGSLICGRRWWAVSGVLLLAMLLLLPTVHHLLPHHAVDSEHAPCPACLLLGVAGLALLVVAALDLVRRRGGRLLPAGSATVASRLPATRCPRAPPASN